MGYTAEIPKDLDYSKPAEGCLPSEVNDSIREISKVLKNLFDIASASDDYTILVTDGIVLIDTTVKAIVATLPPAANCGSASYSKRIYVVNMGTKRLTVDGNAAETINGAANIYLDAKYTYAIFISNGTNWIAIKGTTTSAFADTLLDDTTPGAARTTLYAAFENGDATKKFSAAAGSTGSEVVNISQFPVSLNAVGLQGFPGNLVIQWGITSALGRQTFGTPFAHACLGVLAGDCGSVSGYARATSWDTTGFTLGGDTEGVAFYLAIGW